MTHAVPFNTLAYVKRLVSRGVEAKQAEAHAEALAEVLEEGFLTKQESVATVNNLSNDILSEITALRHEMNTKFAEVNLKFGEMHAKIYEVKSELAKWVLGISLGQVALIISALKFFH